MKDTHHKIPQCDSLNSAGRRCEKSILHNSAEKQPVHKAGAVTWNVGRTETLVEAMTRAVADTYSVPFWSDFAASVGMPLTAWQQQVAETYFGEPELSAEQRLAQWWRDKAEAEIEQTVAKAVEYGATDLIDIGRSIARVAGTNDEIEDDEAAEMGIFFYLEGKLSRWRSAMERGDRPSVDTLLDIGVYARMAQRIRSHGSWPGTDEPQLREGGPVFPSAFPNGTKINQVMWAGRDITEHLGRNSDGTLNVSAEAVDRAVRADNEKRAAEEAEPEPCTCLACKSERSTESREEIDE